MSRNYDYKDQELDFKMRIKFLNKKLREPDHGVEQYEEWQSNLEMVTDELTKVQLKKFKSFLSKWIHAYKEDNQLINVVDCMFVSLGEDEQKDMATKWYHRTIKEKDIKHYQLLAQYTKEENQMLKNREKKGLKAQGEQYKKRLKSLKVENKKAIKNSREALSKNYDKLLRQHVLQLNHYKNKHDENQNILEDMKERIHTLEREKYDLQEKLKKINAMQEEIDKRAEVYKEGLIKSGLKNILQKEDI